MKNNILIMPLDFSPEFGVEVPKEKHCRSFLRGLLKRKVKERLGCGKRGEAKLKAHPFNQALDWARVLAHDYMPPFVPPTGFFVASDKQVRHEFDWVPAAGCFCGPAL